MNGSSESPGARNQSLIQSTGSVSGGNKSSSLQSIVSYLTSKTVLISVSVAAALIIGLSVGLSGKSKPANTQTSSIIARNSIGSIRSNVFYTDSSQPISASLPIFTNASIQFYASCDDLRNDLINAVSIKVNQMIVDFSNIDPKIYDYSAPPTLTDSNSPVEKGSSNEIASTSTSSGNTNTASGESSYGTNNQVAGVDQADVVKSTATHSFGAYGDKLIVWDVVTGKELSVTVMPKPAQNNNDPSGSSTTPSSPYVKRHAMVSIDGRPGFQRVRITGLLMDDTRLTVIVTGYQYFFWPYFYNGNVSKSRILDSYASTSIRIYDISNIPIDGSELPLVASQNLDGTFQDARSINNTAYIVTMTNVNTYPLLYYNLNRFQFDRSLNSSQYIQAATKLAVEKYIPEFVDQLIDEISNLNGNCQGITQLAMFRSVSDNSSDSSSVPSLDSFMEGVANIFTLDMLQTPPLTNANSTTNITFYTTRTFIPNSYTSTIYASKETLVLSAVGYNYYSSLSSWQENTFLMAFQITQGNTNVQGLGSATIPGYLINSYAMDIWDNHLRVASTRRAQWGCNGTSVSTINGVSYTYCTWVQMTDSDNMISVLQLPTSGKTGMNLVGYINGLGDIGESIFAVRFMENRGFMSTFFQRDPFYALDLSNHSNPNVAGYLKIPGFSSYLHPYNSEGSILIAVGQAADDNGVTTGLQITLFNVTDLKSPKSLQTYQIQKNPNVYSSSDAAYDPESFRFLDQSKKLILPVTVWNYTSYDDPSNFDGFYIFDVSPVSGIKKSFEVNHIVTSFGCWYNAYFSSRSLVHNGVLTTLKGHSILAHDLGDASKRWSLNLDTNNTDCGGYWVY